MIIEKGCMEEHLEVVQDPLISVHNSASCCVDEDLKPLDKQQIHVTFSRIKTTSRIDIEG